MARRWCRKNVQTVPLSPTLSHINGMNGNGTSTTPTPTPSSQSTVEWAAQRYAVWWLCNVLLSWVFFMTAFICLQIWPLHPDTLRAWLSSLPYIGNWSADLMDSARERLPNAANDIMLAWVIGKVCGPFRCLLQSE
jgi:hypothetical protein